MKPIVSILLVALLLLLLVACQPSTSDPAESVPEAAALPTEAVEAEIEGIEATDPSADSPTEDPTAEPAAGFDEDKVSEVIVAATKAIRSEERAPTFSNSSGEPEVIEDPQSLADYLPILGPAPEITNEVWINSDEVLRLEDLRGQVVLIEFWTFG